MPARVPSRAQRAHEVLELRRSTDLGQPSAAVTRHVGVSITLYPAHLVGRVTLADDRSMGRPGRALATFSAPVGFLTLRGLTARASVMVLLRAALWGITNPSARHWRPEAPAPPEGATGAAVKPAMPGQMQLPLGV